MSAFTDIINRAKNAETLHDKSQLLTYLGRGLAPAKKKMTAADRDEISTFVLSELEVVPTLLNKAECYREKDEIFSLMDALMGLIMVCFDSPAADCAKTSLILSSTIFAIIRPSSVSVNNAL